jgi:hypothetical protein
MLLAPPTLPRSDNLVHIRAPRIDRGDAALRAPLARLHGLRDSAGRQAAVLGLLMTPTSRREREAWRRATQGVADAPALLDDLLQLPHALQLPWLEYFARSLAPASLRTRHDLMDAARRVMTADGLVSPMDQLRWVALRHLLAGSAVAAPTAATAELAALGDDQVYRACLFSGFLSQMVPTPELALDLTGLESVSQCWYHSVTAHWQDRSDPLPARLGHDIDATLRSLRTLQGLPWMLRPVLARTWFDAARALTEGPVLHPMAADALRLACLLLDSPLPPELARQYIEVDATRH